MALTRDYVLRQFPLGETRTIAVVGQNIALRKVVSEFSCRVVAYDAVTGGTMLMDCLLNSGEKISLPAQFKRLEITSLTQLTVDMLFTVGSGIFGSDIVEGEVSTHERGSTAIGGYISAANAKNTHPLPVGCHTVILCNKFTTQCTVNGFPMAVDSTLEFKCSDSITIDGNITAGQMNYLYSCYI